MSTIMQSFLKASEAAEKLMESCMLLPTSQVAVYMLCFPHIDYLGIHPSIKYI